MELVVHDYLMKNIRWTIRLTLLIVILISIGGITSSYLSFQRQTTVQQEVTASTITETDGITVVTTAPAASRRSGQLIAFAEGGEPVYENSSFDFYFDVDPSLNRDHSVTYVAGNLVNPPKCGARPASGKCGFISVERVNLVTGKVTRIYQEFNRPHIYHDVDRINDSHLLFADIANHRVFMVDLRSGITSWGWSAQINYSVQGGGFFPDDWTHLNDVEYLPDGRIMVSLRNQDQVVFLDKQTGLQENWTLGSENDHSILYEQQIGRAHV